MVEYNSAKVLGKAVIEVINMQGQVVIKKKVTGNLNKLDISSLTGGMYIMNMKASGTIVQADKFSIIR